MILAWILFTGSMGFGHDVIAHWDFSRGKIDSADGKFKMYARGNTRIAGPEGAQYLSVGIDNRDKPEGIMAEKIYPELTPQGAFRLVVRARLREPTGRNSHLVLWDNHNHLNPKTPEPDRKKGLTFYLVHLGDGRFRPQAAFGFGDSLDMVYGNPVEPGEYKDFTIALEYDGVKTISFCWNGELNRSITLAHGGSLSEAVYPLVIGDRYGSRHNRFDGQIVEVKLTRFLPSGK